jgi:hypothetical protein
MSDVNSGLLQEPKAAPTLVYTEMLTHLLVPLLICKVTTSIVFLTYLWMDGR